MHLWRLILKTEYYPAIGYGLTNMSKTTDKTYTPSEKCIVQRYSRFLTYILVSILIFQLAACADNQHLAKADSEKSSGVHEKQPPSLFEEPFLILSPLEVESDLEHVFYLMSLIEHNSLNIFDFDFHDIEWCVKELYSANETLLMNHWYEPGLSLWFTSSGTVAEFCVQTISPEINPEIGLHNIYRVIGEVNYKAKAYVSTSFLLSAQDFPITLTGLILSNNTYYVGRRDRSIDFEASAYVPLSALADCYDGSSVQSIISEYGVGEPLCFNLTSRPLSIGDMSNPAANATFFELTDQGYREMSQSEIARIASYKDGYLEDYKPVWTGSDYIVDTQVLDLNGYWYLTILPYYQHSESRDGVRPILRVFSESEHGMASNVTLDYPYSDAVCFSAENVIVLCFPY
jgi:hypothetical protein